MFFDGVCGLCNGLINFLFFIDKNSYFKVATLQGDFAKENLPRVIIVPLDTIVLLVGEKVYTQSDAVLRVLIGLGGPWQIFRLFYVFPNGLRDFIYLSISKNRYKIFGKKDTCRLPTADDQSRFYR